MGTGGDVVVVGSLNVDLVTRVARHPCPGETVFGRGLDRLPGGKGANQALAAARAGASTRLVGRVGDDTTGAAYLAGLRERGVDVSAVLPTPDIPTGHALIAVDDDGENTIVVIPGANGAVTEHDVERVAGQVRSAGVLVLQLELPMAAVVAAARLAHDAGVRVLLNASPLMPLPAALLATVDMLVVNAHEAAALGDQPCAVVTTLGSRGAVWADGGRRIAVAAPSVGPVDTTGAGDALTGTLAAALAAGLPERPALERAVAAGAEAVTWPGAQGWSLPG